MVTITALPRSRIKMSDREIVEHFNRLGFVSDIGGIVFTIETVEDFWIARQRLWHHPGEVERYEEHGLLVLKNAQPRPNQPSRDIAVVSLGHARAVVGVLPGSDIDPLYPRYAPKMG
jgi:hypothetical protein